MRKLQLMLMLAIGIAISMVVSAAGNGTPTVLYDTFGPEDIYDMSIAYLVGSIDGSNTHDQANPFVIGASMPHYLNKIELAVYLNSGTNQLDVWLMSDAAGEPGAAIEVFNLTDAMDSISVGNPPLVVNSVLHPILYPDTRYWLIASAPAADTFALWFLSLPTLYDTTASRLNSGPWILNPDYPLGAFRITGSSILTIEEILLFVVTCIEDGTLTGNGSGKSAKNRLNALINMLEEAQRLIEAGLLEEACDQLWSAYGKCDGDPKPPDFVTGSSADELASMIQNVIEDLECE